MNEEVKVHSCEGIDCLLDFCNLFKDYKNIAKEIESMNGNILNGKIINENDELNYIIYKNKNLFHLLISRDIDELNEIFKLKFNL